MDRGYYKVADSIQLNERGSQFNLPFGYDQGAWFNAGLADLLTEDGLKNFTAVEDYCNRA